MSHAIGAYIANLVNAKAQAMGWGMRCDGESFSAPMLGKSAAADTILAATYFRVKEHLKVQSA